MEASVNSSHSISQSKFTEELNSNGASLIEKGKSGDTIDNGNAKDCTDDAVSTEHDLDEEVSNDQISNESILDESNYIGTNRKKHVPVISRFINTKSCPTQKEICQAIYRAEKFSKKICLNVFHALPSPSCPQIKCSTWCLLNLPNWLLFLPLWHGGITRGKR